MLDKKLKKKIPGYRKYRIAKAVAQPEKTIENLEKKAEAAIKNPGAAVASGANAAIDMMSPLPVSLVKVVLKQSEKVADDAGKRPDKAVKFVSKALKMTGDPLSAGTKIERNRHLIEGGATKAAKVAGTAFSAAHGVLDYDYSTALNKGINRFVGPSVSGGSVTSISTQTDQGTFVKAKDNHSAEKSSPEPSSSSRKRPQKEEKSEVYDLRSEQIEDSDGEFSDIDLEIKTYSIESSDTP